MCRNWPFEWCDRTAFDFWLSVPYCQSFLAGNSNTECANQNNVVPSSDIFYYIVFGSPIHLLTAVTFAWLLWNLVASTASGPHVCNLKANQKSYCYNKESKTLTGRISLKMRRRAKITSFLSSPPCSWLPRRRGLEKGGVKDFNWPYLA